MTKPATVTAVDGVSIEDNMTDKEAVKELAIALAKRAAITIIAVGVAAVVSTAIANKLAKSANV